MPSSKIKASAFQRPPKFNFLSSRAKTASHKSPALFIQTTGNVDYLSPELGNRRFWAIETTPAQAKRQAQATMRDLEKLQGEPKRGGK